MCAKDELAKAMEAFLAKGGKVETGEEGQRSEASQANDSVRYCTCGCEGNYTDHSMRLGERGMLGK